MHWSIFRPLYFVAVSFLSYFVPGTILAQIQYGHISYVATRNTPVRPGGAEGPAADKISQMLRELEANGVFDQRFVLTFSPDAYWFREEAAKDWEVKDGAVSVTILRNQTSPDEYYTDTETGEYINSVAIADRKFLYRGKVVVPPWQPAETTIPASDATLGFDLRTARAVTSGGDTLIAAYAPALPIALGPLNYYGLPGAILQLDVCNAGKCTRYRATGFTAAGQHPDPPIPAEGKAVSAEEFFRQREKYRARTATSTVRTYRN